jgi:miniconductance mechanosensitive channel
LTNLGLFRNYIELYLKKHPKIHQELTFLIRQLEVAGKGIPIELYVFTNDTNWAHYEGIQADIFDHLYAIAPYFELNVFQYMSGQDLNIKLDRNTGAALGV